MAAGEGQGEDWQAFLNLGGAEDEEAPPALAAHAQPALVEDDDDNLPPPAHGGIGVPPALPVLPQGEVLGMIGELVDPVGPAAAHGADPPVHGADGGPALVLLPPPPQQQQQGVPPIVGMLEEQVMLMQGEPVLEQDDLLGQHGLAAADDGADLPVDGVPAPPLAPPPQQQQQQQPVPVVLTDDVREEDLEEASQMWNENQQALKRQQNEMLGPAPAAKRLAMDMFAAPPSVGFNFDGGGGGGSSSLFSSAPHQGIGMHYSVVAPRQVAAVGDAAIVPVVMPQIGPGGVPPALAVQGPGFSFKEPPLERCKNCGFRPAILSRASRSTTSLNPFQQHTCLCEICQLSDSFRIAACDYCGDYAANNPLPH